MAVQQIVLALPQRSEKTPPADKLDTTPLGQSAQALSAALIRAIRQRNRWVFTAKKRAQRELQFALAVKSVMKDLTTDAVDAIADRKVRQETRIQLYADLMVFVRDMTKEHTRLADRARTATQWSVAALGLTLAAVGILLRSWLA